MPDIQRPPRIAFATLGCKANQYESGRLASEFAARGCEVVPADAEADILVVNTCTVTNAADAKSRARLRRLKRLQPNALIIATGCSAEIGPTALIPLADVVIPNARKLDLVDTALAHRGKSLPLLTEDAVPMNADSARLPSLGRTRALLMIQDGCEDRCAYCIIPRARPNVHSRDFDEVLREAAELVQRGYCEIVLTGISIGSWRVGPRRLPDLLTAIAAIPGVKRVRLSSIEPRTVTESLLEAYTGMPVLCRHLHIPLQSGDDETLKAMGRTYDTDTYMRLINRVRAALPDAGISTDVIVGFPTETDESFGRTVRFCEEMDFCKIHVFPFSPRAGTPAADMRDIVGSKARKERAARLIAVSDTGVQRWAERAVGTLVSVVAESREAGGFYSGLTGNGVRVVWKSDEILTGHVISVHVKEALHGTALGEAVAS